jgi:hypothetical protein
MPSLTPFKINTSKNSCTTCISLIHGHLNSPIINTSINFDFKLPIISTSKKTGGGGSSCNSSCNWRCAGLVAQPLLAVCSRRFSFPIHSQKNQLHTGKSACATQFDMRCSGTSTRSGEIYGFGVIPNEGARLWRTAVRDLLFGLAGRFGVEAMKQQIPRRGLLGMTPNAYGKAEQMQQQIPRRGLLGMTPSAYGETATERSLVVRTPRDDERGGLSSTGTLACLR